MQLRRGGIFVQTPETTATDLVEAVREFLQLGWAVFPVHGVKTNGQCTCGNTECKRIGKHPRTVHGVKDATCDEQTIRRWFARWPDAGIALATGSASRIFVLDIDPRHGGDESLTALEQKFGELPRTRESRTGGGGRHLFFLMDPNQTIHNSTSKLGLGLDVRSEGGYVVLPPSLHLSGNRYQWVNEKDSIPLPQWLAELSAKNPSRPRTETVNRSIPEGQRNSHLASLAGTMGRRYMSPAAIEAALLVENQKCCVPPLDEPEVRGIARSVSRYTPADHGAREQMSHDWPRPEPIHSQLPPVEPFSEDLLPDLFRPLVEDVTERMQVPIDYPAVVIMLCLAGVVNRRAVIHPKALDTGWVIVPNLWGGIIGPPGFMKSPVIQYTTRPLNQIQTGWRREYEETLKDHAKAKEEYEIRYAAWKEVSKANMKIGKEAPGRPLGEAKKANLRRLIVNDATFEALHRTMSENPAGIFVVRDELTGWWSTLDRAGREGERAFCLQAWNGDTGHTIDRIGRGTIHVDACCMSMLGGIQPARLRSYLVDALEDGPNNDGLIQRFQLTVWPDTEPGWTYVDRAPDGASEQQVAQVFRELVDLDPENPRRFHFAPEAQELFIDWLTELEAKVRGSDLHSALISHLSKYRKLMPAVALLCELANGADGGNKQVDTVSLENARKAAGWCDYVESHARRIYSCIVTPQLRAARELADKIKKRAVGLDGFFTNRDVYLKGWSGLDSPDVVMLAVEVLEDAQWVRNVSKESGFLGGRPSKRYVVNPRIWE
jgi:hypothetical protein